MPETGNLRVISLRTLSAAASWIASTSAHRTSGDPCLVMRPRLTLTSDSPCRGVSPAHARFGCRQLTPSSCRMDDLCEVAHLTISKRWSKYYALWPRRYLPAQPQGDSALRVSSSAEDHKTVHTFSPSGIIMHLAKLTTFGMIVDPAPRTGSSMGGRGMTLRTSAHSGPEDVQGGCDACVHGGGRSAGAISWPVRVQVRRSTGRVEALYHRD